MGLALSCPSVGDVDALGGIAADVGWTTGGGGLDEMTALFQPFLPFIQHSVGPGGKRLSARKPPNPQQLSHSVWPHHSFQRLSKWI